MNISQLNGNQIVDTTALKQKLLTYNGTVIKDGDTTVNYTQIKAFCDGNYEVKILWQSSGLLYQYTAFDDDALWFGTFWRQDGEWNFARLIINSSNVISVDEEELQKKLNTAQTNAVNSGVTATKVSTYDGYATSKQNSLSTDQLSAVNSGITSSKVSTYDGYATSKQNKLTFDSTPTSGSNNPVTSGGVYSAISAITGVSFQVVQTLPSTGSANVIYLVPKTGSTNDIYNEYIYINSAWEIIGSTQIDLTGYVKSSDDTTFTGENTFNGQTDFGNHIYIWHGLNDDSGSVGDDGQVLTSTGEGVKWKSLGSYKITAITETADAINVTIESV